MSDQTQLRQLSQDELDGMLRAHRAHSNVDFNQLLIKGLATLEGCEFRNIDFSSTRFEDTEVKNCKFIDADLTHATLPKVIGCEFQRCKMVGVTFKTVERTRFAYLSFAGATLHAVEFTSCQFDWLNFKDSIFTHFKMKECEFDFCKFVGVKDMRFGDFGGAYLQDCDLTNVDIQFCKRFVLDNTVTPGLRLPLRSNDPWSDLVRSYTGAKLLFNFLFLAAFFAPFIMKGLGLIALSHFEARLSERFASLAQKTAEHPYLAEIQQALNPCSASRCEPIPIWRVLLGHDVSPWVFWIGVALLLYNVARLFLTWRIAPLKEEEVVSGRSPYFLPRWTKKHVWEAIQHRDWTALKKYNDELSHVYAPLWWIHKGIKYAFWATLILSVAHLIGFFQEKIYLPTRM